MYLFAHFPWLCAPFQDYIDTEMLLSSENVNQEALLGYAREAADFGTNYQLPTLDYAMNHCGQPDVAMFDFTSMYASENAAQVRDRFGHQLLVTLVGDSLLEVRTQTNAHAHTHAHTVCGCKSISFPFGELFWNCVGSL